MNGWIYRGYDGDKAGPAPIVVRLAGWLELVDPDGESWGIMPSQEHRRRSPRSIHNCGRALDWHPSSTDAGWYLAHILTEYPDGGLIDGLLWRDYQWGFTAGRVWVRTSRTDHDDHLHIESRGWA